MDGRDALKALANGHRVHCADWAEGAFVYLDPIDNMIHDENGDIVRSPIAWDNDHPWSTLKIPASDSQLIERMHRLAEDDSLSTEARAAYRHCAQMLGLRELT